MFCHPYESSLELDTHSDTTVLGKSCLVFQDFDCPSGWDPSAGSKDCLTVSGVVLAYEHLQTGKTYKLVCHHTIYNNLVDIHLICLMQ